MEVYPDLVPVTVKKLRRPAKSGLYEGLIWHRVEYCG
jgi:cyclophilin family peptidyl-prolyl cis-trans isomerase